MIDDTDIARQLEEIKRVDPIGSGPDVDIAPEYDPATTGDDEYRPPSDEPEWLIRNTPVDSGEVELYDFDRRLIHTVTKSNYGLVWRTHPENLDGTEDTGADSLATIFARFDPYPPSSGDDILEVQPDDFVLTGITDGTTHTLSFKKYTATALVNLPVDTEGEVAYLLDLDNTPKGVRSLFAGFGLYMLRYPADGDGNEDTGEPLSETVTFRFNPLPPVDDSELPGIVGGDLVLVVKADKSGFEYKKATAIGDPLDLDVWLDGELVTKRFFVTDPPP